MLKTGIRNTAAITAAFLLYGVLRVCLYGVDLADLISQLFTGAVILVWGIFVLGRVTDRRLRRLLTGLSAFLLLILLMQTVNYRFAQNQEALRRYAWYGYYVCEMAAAVLFYYAAVFCGREPEKKAGTLSHLLPAAGTAACLGIQTNDLHSLAFSFTTEVRLPGSPKHFGPFYYLFFFFLFFLCFAAVMIFVRKHRAIRRSKSLFLLPLPLLIMTLLFILDTLNRTLRVGGVKVWQTGEVFCFCVIAFLEMCIDYGLIPANTGYGEAFSLIGSRAVILDKEGTVRYVSSEAEYPFADDADTLVCEHPVSGGKIVWQADVGKLRRLNRRLEETTRRIEARNDYLASRTQVEKEMAETEARSRIYDNISRALRPQLDRLSAMAEGPEEAFDKCLPDIAVLSAYIKRRSNMELMAEDGRLPFEELSLAVSESLNCLKLKGIRTALSASGTGSCPAARLIGTYELLERIIEAALETLTALVVSLKAEPGALSMRVLVSAASFTLPPESISASGEGRPQDVSVTKEGQDLIFHCIFRKGGEP